MDLDRAARPEPQFCRLCDGAAASREGLVSNIVNTGSNGWPPSAKLLPKFVKIRLQIERICYAGKYLLHIKGHVWVDSDVFDWLASGSLTFHTWFRRGEPGPHRSAFPCPSGITGMGLRDLFARGEEMPAKKDPMQCQCVE
jgi:hypothetical protein